MPPAVRPPAQQPVQPAAAFKERDVDGAGFVGDMSGCPTRFPEEQGGVGKQEAAVTKALQVDVTAIKFSSPLNVLKDT